LSSEKDVVRALREGIPGAVEKMVILYGDRLLKSSYLLCGDEAKARDLVQETFLQAMQAIRRFKEKSSLYTWLYGILLNLNRRQIRNDRRLTFPGELPEAPHRDSPDLERDMDRQTIYSHLHGAIQSLSDSHREIIVLRYFEGLKLEEISGILGISKGTVKSRLFYAGEYIRKKMPGELNLFNLYDTKGRKNNEM
jgi:RNA polymerase sigma-70 factor (ECF subfamily)